MSRSRLARGERGGRLVEHQHARVLRERAHDLDDLLQPDAELADRLGHVDLVAEAEALEQRARLASSFASSTRPKRRGSRPSRRFSATRQLRHQHQLLVHDRDAGARARPPARRSAGSRRRATHLAR